MYDPFEDEDCINAFIEAEGREEELLWEAKLNYVNNNQGDFVEFAANYAEEKEMARQERNWEVSEAR